MVIIYVFCKPTPSHACAREIEKLRLVIRELEGEFKSMKEEISPMLRRAMGNSYHIINAYGPIGPKGRITQQNIYNQNDLAAIRKLIENIQTNNTSLEQIYPLEKIAEIQNSLVVLQEQITAQIPDHSIIKGTLKSLKTIFEGAAGAVVASGWLEMIQQLT
jgi:hypothetical protein